MFIDFQLLILCVEIFFFLVLFLPFVIRMMSDYKVEMINDGMQEFYVDFHGPSESKSSIPLYLFYFIYFPYIYI